MRKFMNFMWDCATAIVFGVLLFGFLITVLLVVGHFIGPFYGL